MTAPAVANATGQTSAVALAAAGRATQLALRAQLLVGVRQMWPMLDAKRINETFPAWMNAMALLTRHFQERSSAAAADTYRAVRTHAVGEPTPPGLVKLANPPADEWMAKAFRFSGPGMLSRDTARPGTALTTTLGTASRVMFDGARTTTTNTVLRDDKAVGWYRLTDGDPCAFCAMLAGRGAVYKSTTVGFEAHNDCACIPVAAYTRDPSQLPFANQEYAALYQQATRGVKSRHQLQAFRAALEGRPILGKHTTSGERRTVQP